MSVRSWWGSSGLGLVMLGALAGPARAAPEESPDAAVLRTRLEDAARTGEWRDLVVAADALRRTGVPLGQRTLVLEAEARLRLGDVPSAVSALDDLLALRPDHIAGLALLARVRADAGDADQAKDLLVLAAQAGRPVLADLREDERAAGAGAQPTGPLRRGLLAPFLRDPRFVLRVMRANREGGGEVAPTLRDPFAAPRRSGPPDDEREPKDPRAQERAALERDLLAALDDLERMTKARDVEGLAPAYAAASARFARWMRLDPPQARVDAVLQRLSEGEGEWTRVLLAFYVARGNDLLRTLGGALEEDRFDGALAAAAELEALAERMRASGRDAFARNADAFVLRVRPLAARARTLKRVAALGLRVTGIVLPPPGSGEAARAIVDDRILGEGDAPDGPDGEVLDVRVVSITKGTVTFRLEDVEFVRPLQREASRN